MKLSDNIEIIHGNCFNVMDTIEDRSIDLIIADPPYNINYKYIGYKDNLQEENYFDIQFKFVKQCSRILKDNGSLFYLNYPEFNCKLFTALNENSELKPIELITWVYNTHTSGKPLRKAFRTWIWASKGTPINNFYGEYKNKNDKRVKKLMDAGRKPREYDWWHIEQVKNVSKEKTEHPCQLPEKMIEKIVLGATNEGDTVLDPFMGSGTTGIVCERLNRNFIGIEISLSYFEISKKRIEEELNKVK